MMALATMWVRGVIAERQHATRYTIHAPPALNELYLIEMGKNMKQQRVGLGRLSK
jgi:hypothetical protein